MTLQSPLPMLADLRWLPSPLNLGEGPAELKFSLRFGEYEVFSDSLDARHRYAVTLIEARLKLKGEGVTVLPMGRLGDLALENVIAIKETIKSQHSRGADTQLGVNLRLSPAPEVSVNLLRKTQTGSKTSTASSHTKDASHAFVAPLGEDTWRIKHEDGTPLNREYLGAQKALCSIALSGKSNRRFVTVQVYARARDLNFDPIVKRRLFGMPVPLVQAATAA